jgi:hypothetical protein
MFAITEFSRTTQRVACMLMSVLIVSTSLAVGAYGAYAAAHPDYLVTISQVQ